mgnify:CR=1 FL=1
MKKPLLIFIVLLFSSLFTSAQLLHSSTQEFTRDDSLRGSITPERAWWDLTYYELRLQVQPENKFFKGSTTVHYQVLTENQRMQIDLQPPLYVTKVIEEGKEISFTKDGANAYIIQLEKKQQKGQKGHIVVFYEGHPREAKRAPWDGGVSWKKDKDGNDFIATSCQGLGASVWWPCKDHGFDEPDSGATVSIVVLANMVAVSNGNLKKIFSNIKNFIMRQFKHFIMLTAIISAFSCQEESIEEFFIKIDIASAVSKIFLRITPGV